MREHRRPLFPLALAALVAAPSFGSASAAEPATGAPPNLLERARALLNDPASFGDATDSARTWARENLNTQRAKSLLADIRADARRRIDDAVEAARVRHAKEMGVRVFNTQPLSLGNAAWSPVIGTQPGGADVALPSRIVLLVHGLDEPGDIWNDLVPFLHAAGHTVARFDYPNDGPIREAAGRLTGWLRALQTRGVRSVDLVCHSMGGLVARDALTRAGLYAGECSGHPDLPDITRLVMVATPNKGSAWAHAEFLAECRDQFQRLLENGTDADAGSALGWMVDGRGEAADDLLPGSAFLTELNARPAPRGVAMTSIVGRAVTPESLRIDELLASRFVRALLSPKEIDALSSSVARASESLGDGPVSTESATLGAGKTVRIDAAHNSMLRRLTLRNMVAAAALGDAAQDPPPAIPVILDALKK